MDIATLVKTPDTLFSKAHLKIRPEKKSLIVLLLHGLFTHKQEMKQHLVDPQLMITTQRFQQCIQYFQEHDYQFVSPDDILKGLSEDQYYAMITFDDGYYNNMHALSILESCDVPAVIFVSSNHIQHQQNYWWDVIYRQRKKQGATMTEILCEQEQVKLFTHDQIHQIISQRYGTDSMQPVGNIDRPMTPNELKNISQHKLISIGNHTKDHAILTNYTAEQIQEQVGKCQQFIKNTTGKDSITLSYPNGNYSLQIMKIAENMGIQLGFTVDQKKNFISSYNSTFNPLEIGRFEVTQQGNIIDQSMLIRSDIVWYRYMQNMLQNKKQKT